MAPTLQRRTLLLVTGASRGLGRELAVKLTARLASGSVVVLTARNEADLMRTAEMIALTAPPDVRVVPLACDLAVADDHDLERIVGAGLESNPSVEAAMIIHNSGSVGDVSRTALQHDSVASADSYFRLNVAAVVALNGVFLRQVGQRAAHVTVINISSLCALQPFKSMSLYCAGKAARDMFFRVLAAEHPELRVLNYAPGPLVTDMARTVADTTADPDIQKMFREGVDGGFLTCATTVERLINALESDKFESGSHVDYFDKDE
ncbi:sepiapterin reductase-like [Amphibalanus amphitrite]|uniref:sepiapterin reductase-like n=1 Tax=Amphibalanus amphitrite TaxID=1232801 RepID=UPI001C92052E|nr:sepiapterin reductase-like [Amphibalanus amphitrite]XP_043202444.1 sepiapterin reductase-like [Amphibalanus amphitrite]